MTNVIPSLVLSTYSPKRHICIYLTKSDFTIASAIFWNGGGTWTDPGRSPPQMARNAETAEGSAVTTSRNKKHEQGTSAPGPSHSQVVWGTRTRTHSKVRPLNSYHEFMSVWDREVEQEVREGIAEGKGCPGTATGSLHGRTSMDFQILPWFSHPPPELPPWETGPTSSMFVMIKCANVCRHVRTPCHVKYSMKGSYCCGWKKGAQNWKHAGCGEVCSQDKTAEREGY